MRLPVESNERTEVLQEEIVSLAKDIIDINDKLDKMNEIEGGIVSGCIEICEAMEERDKKVNVIQQKLNFHREDIEEIRDELKFRKVFIIILFIFLIIWNFILTYHIVNGL